MVSGMCSASSTGCALRTDEASLFYLKEADRCFLIRRGREHGGKSLALSTMCGGGLRKEARRCEGEWEHPVEVAKFGKKIVWQAAKMKLPDDGLVEKKAKQDGEQREKRFQSACICTVM